MRLIFIFFLSITYCTSMRQQSVGIKGILKCGDKPAANVRVKLWDEDEGPDPDDLLDEGYTDANGNFKLQGSEREATTIDPIFKVYHDCNDGMKPGYRKVKFRIPKSYITSGKAPKRVYDIGVLNLETVYSKEERELLSRL
ncbi:unnamed protein product [Cylicocyclus nassatus]|uniref:Transthyretin-like family protein n=1 Tax=Cylicocyclus nassatus TaxID=53992 RepID=A0AA36H4B7_CYLNA|nr:unnamed protein product [Cylicocyclus nassatus]